MADFPGPPQANYTAPDGLATIGSLMSLKSKQLAIQGQQQGLQGQAADVQMKQQDASQRAGLANIDWDKHLGPDGILDTGSFAKDPAIRKAAGDQYPDILAKANQVRAGQLQNQQSLLSLNKDQIGAFGSIVGGLKTDPDVQSDTPAGRQKVTNAFTQAAQMYGPGMAKVAQAYAPMVQHAPPGKLPGALQALQLQTESAGKQIEMTSPGGAMVQGPGGMNVVNTNPNAATPVGATVGQPAAQGLAPVEKLPQAVTTPAGVINRNPVSGALTAAPASGPINPSQAQASAMTGQAQAITERVAHAQEQANSTVQTQDALVRAQHLLESGNVNTGGTFEIRKNIKNFLAGVGIDTKGADDTNSLVKNLARYEAGRATASGLGGTDAARELAHTGSPNTAIDTAALKGIVRQSLATEKAIQAYGNATSKTTDPQALAGIEKKFRSIPNLIQGYEYGLTKSPQEANEFLNKHGISKDDMKGIRGQIKNFEAQ